MLFCLAYMPLLENKMICMLAGDEIQDISLVGIVAILEKGPFPRTKIDGCNSRISFYKRYNYEPEYEWCD